MSPYISDTTGLESKAQLKAHRKHRWQGLLLQNGLDPDLQRWWTQEELDLEESLWEQADVEYEERKTALKAKLDKLAPAELDTYFTEIGVAKTSVADYLRTAQAGRIAT